jgi:ABC-type transporter Mla subunit MlaD
MKSLSDQPTMTPTNIAGSRSPARAAAWFTAAPLVALAAFVGLVAFKQHWFSATDHLYVIADTSAGIATGMPVKLQGFAVGSVKSMALVPPEGGKAPRVRLSLEVNRENMAYIGKDATLRLSREGLIGPPILEIVQGDPRARRAAEGDVLAFDRPRNLNEIADDLNARAAPVLDDAKEFMQKLKDPQGDLMHTLATTRQIVKHMDDTTVAVGKLVTHGDQVVTNVGREAERALASGGNILQRTEQVMPRIEESIDNIAQATRSVAKAATRAEALADGGERIVDDAGQVIKGARRSWPLNLWAPEVRDAALVDSQDNSKSFIVPAKTP